ncbi:MAG: inosine/xanthosine triphosphatase [Bacteroidota bacterium]|nr:inosine/xanthosine triphosphatase [Bacteroidota bacterium]MDP4192987.1 inosine/xanthosine triphosphatase [Bacteroidota bacterium]MDP4194582.1 inosine/xanthosine triphosphatase [Bacteroidota bacterium]
MLVLIGSQNPVKVKSTEEAFQKYFPDVNVQALDVQSNVPVQPVNDDTFTGARNRAMNLFNMSKNNDLGADFFVGIEGGIINLYNKWFGLGAMCIIDKNGNTGFGTSPNFELPNEIVKELLNGKELGLVMDELMNQSNTKQKMGAISYFTKGVLDRKDLYVQGLVVAMVPFLHSEMFF